MVSSTAPANDAVTARDPNEPTKTSPDSGLVPRPSQPAPIKSETPWRSFEFRVGADLIAPNLSQGAQSQPTATVPEATLEYSSLVASPNGELYMFGGEPGPRGLFRLDLDTHNSTVTIRSVQASGICPSPRTKHTAVWIDSFMVVWGGRTTSVLGETDADLHVFNPSES